MTLITDYVEVDVNDTFKYLNEYSIYKYQGS